MSSKQNKRAAREQLKQERQRQATADKRKRTITNVVIGVVVVAVIVGVFVVVQNQRTSTSVTDAALPPLVSEQSGGMSFGDGEVTVNLWEDFQCPACKDFEAANAKMLKQKVDDGEITLVVHPLSFLDQSLNNDSSVLAANAFGCSAVSGETAALDFHAKLFEVQPPEQPGTPAWSNEDLIGWGGEVGVDDAGWSDCVNNGTYNDWVSQVAASQVDAGVTGTPTVFIDGERWEGGDLAAAIDAAADAA